MNRPNTDANTTVFGQLPNGQTVHAHTISYHPLTITVIEYGARLKEVHLATMQAGLVNVCLGLPSLEDYLNDTSSLGATVGRVANRISHGQFSLANQTIQLNCHDGEHHLHGGPKGFGQQLWQGEIVEDEKAIGIKLSYTSIDGEEHYPGTLQVTTEYWLNQQHELIFNYTAHSDQDTPINLTNHTYWNLAGTGSKTILNHELCIPAARYIVCDNDHIPTGELACVTDTPWDFRTLHKLGARIEHTPPGYDHGFVYNDASEKKLRYMATLHEPKNQCSMTVYSTQNTLQLYTGNHLQHALNATQQPFCQHQALCLETQNFPDAINHPHFPSPILKAGETYQQTTIHRFSG